MKLNFSHLFFFLFLGIFTLTAQDESPYAIFGYEGKVLMTPQERQDYMLMIPNADADSEIVALGIEPAKGAYYYFDADNNVVETDVLERGETARFLSVDPLTSSYPWYTPYQFAGNKVISNIDIDGLEDFYFNLTQEGGDIQIELIDSDHTMLFGLVDKEEIIYHVNYNGEKYKFWKHPSLYFQNSIDTFNEYINDYSKGITTTSFEQKFKSVWDELPHAAVGAFNAYHTAAGGPYGRRRQYFNRSGNTKSMGGVSGIHKNNASISNPIVKGVNASGSKLNCSCTADAVARRLNGSEGATAIKTLGPYNNDKKLFPIEDFSISSAYFSGVAGKGKGIMGKNIFSYASANLKEGDHIVVAVYSNKLADSSNPQSMKAVGHFFNIEKKNGKIIIHDGQTETFYQYGTQEFGTYINDLRKTHKLGERGWFDFAKIWDGTKIK